MIRRDDIHALPRPCFREYISLAIAELSKLPRALQRTPPMQHDKAGFYEAFFGAKNEEEYYTDARIRLRRRTIQAALAHVGRADLDVLDVGCGLGDVLSVMPASARLHCVDISRRNIDFVRRRFQDRVKAREATIERLPFPPASMDLIFSLEVFEHVGDDTQAVAELARVLRPNGWLLASVPSTYYWPQYRRLYGHHRHYTRKSLTTPLARHGLCIELYFPNYPNYPNWHRQYILLYVLLRTVSLIARSCNPRATPATLTWPTTHRPILSTVERRLEPVLERDAHLNYSTLPTSTFVLVRHAKQTRIGAPPDSTVCEGLAR